MKIINNQLYIGNHLVSDLAKQYQTPLMIFDQEQLTTNFLTFKKFNGQPVYASKALLTPYIIKQCQIHDYYIDAVSGGDLFVLKQSGFDLTKVFFHGNNKSIEELQFAIDHHVIIVVDNLGELNKLIDLSQNKLVKTFFRVNPGIDAHTHYYIQTSLKSSKFGESIYDFEVMDQVIKQYLSAPNIQLLGFHSHIGSQIIDGLAFVKNAQVMIDFTKMIATKYQIKLKEVNLGGGFGIKYTDEVVNHYQMIEQLNQFIEKYLDEINYSLDQVYIEPGRSIVGNAGTTIYQMQYLKETYGKKRYVFVDGGMTDNIRPALYQAKYQVFNACQVEGEKIIADVVGKCCESGDIIVTDGSIVYQQFDYLAVCSTGAYCYPMSSNYNNALRPAIIVVDNSEVIMMARRETYQDLIKLFY